MPFEEDLCDACGYHRILKKVLDTSGVRPQEDATGFERIFRGQVHESESPENALFWASVVAGLLLVFFCSMCLGIWGFLFGIFCVLGYVAICLATREQRQKSGGGVNQDPISIFLWSVLLIIQRAAGWRLPKWPFPKTRVLTLHDPTFDDRDLSELDGLEGFEVLDLEGTQITDAGLLHLADLKKLRFVVLRKTRVTPGGVGRLQRALRRAWIWH
jgi:hypothetical protein